MPPIYSMGAASIKGFGFTKADTAAAVVARGFWFGQASPSGNQTSQLQQTLIATLGNTANFGTLPITSVSNGAASGSSTRGITQNGSVPAGSGNTGAVSTMYYFTFGTTGTTSTFGNSTSARYAQNLSFADKTRMVGGTGSNSSATQLSDLYYVTIATTGNASSFGFLNKVMNVAIGCDSPTYGYAFFGSSASVDQSQIQYVTIQTTGNSTSFGNASASLIFGAGSSNSTRAVMGSGLQGGSAFISTLYYFTLGTSGSQTTFGNLSSVRYTATATTGQTRMLFGGGSALSAPTVLSQIDYITIATTGNSTSFGFLTGLYSEGTGLSNDHGGLN